MQALFHCFLHFSFSLSHYITHFGQFPLFSLDLRKIFQFLFHILCKAKNICTKYRDDKTHQISPPYPICLIINLSILLSHQLKYVLLRSLFTDSIPLSSSLLFRSIKASHDLLSSSFFSAFLIPLFTALTTSFVLYASSDFLCTPSSWIFCKI